MRKLLTIGELADMLSINASTIRHYEREGLIKASKIDDNNYRLYDFDKFDRMQNLILLRDLDIPLKDLKELIENYSVEKYIRLLNASLDNINKTIDLLEEKRKSVNKKISYAQKINNEKPQFKIISKEERRLLKIHSGNLLAITPKEVYDFMKQFPWFKHSAVDHSYMEKVDDENFNYYIEEDLFEEAREVCEVHTLTEGNYITYAFFLEIDPTLVDEEEIVKAEDQIIDDSIRKFDEYVEANSLNVVGPKIFKQVMRSSHFALYSFHMTIEALIE